jgi:hypothetical protein
MSSNQPQPKVVAGGIAGAVSILVIYAANLLGIDVPPEVASSFTVLVSFAAGYIKK